MPRRLRIEFEGPIYLEMARGNARQKIVRDDAGRRRLIEGLEHAVIRYGGELPSYAVMTNYFHLLLRPEPGQSISRILQSLTVESGHNNR
jgi:putative transposase